MKSILLALCLLVPSQGFAAYCSKVKGNEPCTPDPGDETDLAKQDILDIIASAQKTEAMVRKLEKAYLTIRRNPSSTRIRWSGSLFRRGQHGPGEARRLVGNYHRRWPGADSEGRIHHGGKNRESRDYRDNALS